MGMGSESRERPGSPGLRTRRLHRRAVAVGLVLSLAVHAALVLLPPFQADLPDHLERHGEIVLVPPPADAPPEVDVPAPPDEISWPAEPEVQEGPVEVAEETQPRFVPHDVPPKLENPDALRDYLELFYPTPLLAASVEGAVHVWLYVNEHGEATRVQIRSSSGSPQFDRLARSAAPFMRFRPALNQGSPIGVWVSLWLRFDIEPPAEEETRLAGGVAD